MLGRYIAIGLQSALYILAGINHFRKPEPFAAIVPGFLPGKLPIVYVSGIAEILLGTLILFRSTRRIAGTGIIILLIAIFPANIKMAIDFVGSDNRYAWLTIARLPLQFVLIWLAWWSTRLQRSNE